MNVILDTNVLMSGIFCGGVPGKILELWSEDRFVLVVSESIFSEYKRVAQILEHKYQFDSAQKVLDFIAVSSFFVNPIGVKHPKCEDPDDDKFLAAAVLSHAKYIVSGDKALLKVKKYPGGAVVSPQHFITVF